MVSPQEQLRLAKGMPVQFRRNIYSERKLLFPTGSRALVEDCGEDEEGSFLTVQDSTFKIREMDFDFTRSTQGTLHVL